MRIAVDKVGRAVNGVNDPSLAGCELTFVPASHALLPYEDTVRELLSQAGYQHLLHLLVRLRDEVIVRTLLAASYGLEIKLVESRGSLPDVFLFGEC